jgi:hypothetical protein
MVRFDTYNASAHLVRQLEHSGRVEVVHDGGDNLLVQVNSGERISIHLIETVIPPYEIRQTLVDNQQADIHTLFVLWGEMFLPEHGTVYVPDEWLSVLCELYGGKIYAFGVYGKDIHIFPVYFEKRGFERLVRYGSDVNVAQLSAGQSAMSQNSALRGTWQIADFIDPRHQKHARGQEQHQQRTAKTPSVRKTAWEILGVTQQADRETVKQAYRQLARKLHPDVNQSGNATLQMQIINEAYDAMLRTLEAAE